MANRLTSSGHIILVRGYDGTSFLKISNLFKYIDEDNLICNDPYGDANQAATYGKLCNGEAVVYTWDFVYFSTIVSISHSY